MLKQALGTAVAAVFATAIAGAQTPAQSQQDQRDYRAGQQTVTVEGCLQQDRSVTAQVADASRDDDKRFMLVDAQVQPGGAMAADRTADSPVGTAGQPDTERAGAQTETAVGTSGAGAAATSATKFRVSGLDDDRLSQYVGQRVRIEGTIESGEHHGMTGAERRDESRPVSDRAATDPADTAGPVGTTGTPEHATPGASAQDHSRATAGDYNELKATSITPIAGSCPDAPASR
jgi:hypothetical protein